MNWAPTTVEGWGRVKQAHMLACAPSSPEEAQTALRASDGHGLIAHGAGRSYGDAALNDGGRALMTRGMARILAFDADNGEVICEPGVSFRQLLDTLLPRGFLAPVTPGTGFASLGGAIANDVHGKNHEVAGSFGDHVRWMDLLLPAGRIVRVDPQRQPVLFAATLGGLGLTGIILRVAFGMQVVPSNAVRLRERRIRNLDEFLAAFDGETSSFSVGWLDGMARGAQLGRGILETAELSDVSVPLSPTRKLAIPCNLPGWVLNPWTVQAFNSVYYRRVPAGGRERLLGLHRFLYPLDAVSDWNRMYGRRGFYQFQCVLPEAESPRGLPRLLETIADARAASFLAVLKRMGGAGRGYLSFPMRGHTLALDFPARAGTRALLQRLEAITLEHGGRVYLAKDASLSAQTCRAMYPDIDVFRDVLDRIDPEGRMNSDLARRLDIRGHAFAAKHRHRPVVADTAATD